MILPAQRQRSLSYGVTCAILLLVVGSLHLMLGATRWLSPAELMQGLRGPSDDSIAVIVQSIRLPRLFACLLAGWALGSVGAVFQSVFRNPLAEPYVVGVSSGAALGGVIAILTGFASALGGFGLFAASVCGGLLLLILVLGIASRRIESSSLLLAGVALGAMVSGVVTALLVLGGQDTNRVVGWLFGSTDRALPAQLWLNAGVLTIALAIFWRHSRKLDALSMGETDAHALGVGVPRWRATFLVAGTLVVSAVVGMVGVIGFVGLIAPHVVRRTVGTSNRTLVLLAGLTGALLLVSADVIAQRAIGTVPVPVGAVTAIVGGPLMVWLLARSSLR